MKRSGHSVKSVTKPPTIPRGMTGTHGREGMQTFAFAFLHFRMKKRRIRRRRRKKKRRERTSTRVSPRLRFKDSRASVHSCVWDHVGRWPKTDVTLTEPQISPVTSYSVHVSRTIPFQIWHSVFFFFFTKQFNEKKVTVWTKLLIQFEHVSRSPLRSLLCSSCPFSWQQPYKLLIQLQLQFVWLVVWRPNNNPCPDW